MSLLQQRLMVSSQCAAATGSGFLESKGQPHGVAGPTREVGSCMPSLWSELWKSLKKFVLLMAR